MTQECAPATILPPAIDEVAVRLSWFSKAQNKEDWSTTPSTLPDTPAPDQLLSGSDGPKPLHAQIAQPPSSKRIICVNGQCGSDANASQLTLLLAGGAARNRYSCDCQACTRSPVNEHFWQPQRMARHTVVTLVSSLQTVYPSQRRVCPSPRDLDKRTPVRGFSKRLHRVSGPKDAICGMKGTAREPREANQGVGLKKARRRTVIQCELIELYPNTPPHLGGGTLPRCMADF
ncbi:hypothetical protein B0J12DRAFT_701536 [Macrophomina phaseolina]|uniref:Uncharacterized protein n=1 Tax=Macrophomina phaseolina TaxID=35725 RepID=A0ABQ8G7F4_9PEZI|nr:hypothetical protein B0J12DRAFT_701536 [Macrophomina phaseolina]